MKYVFLDIEIAPSKIENEDVIEYLMNKKITKESRSMDPAYSKIIVIGIKFSGESETNVFWGEDEKELLEIFWDFIKKQKAQTGDLVFVTHNGYKFDIPFLIVRSVINGIEMPVSINTNRWSMKTSNHFDIMMFFSQFETFINPNLDIFAKMHGIEVPEERISGSDIENLFKSAEWDKIKQKCIQDVELTEKVFEKFGLKRYSRRY